jgi:hypothetical protein
MSQAFAGIPFDLIDDPRVKSIKRHSNARQLPKTLPFVGLSTPKSLATNERPHGVWISGTP